MNERPENAQNRLGFAVLLGCGLIIFLVALYFYDKETNFLASVASKLLASFVL